MAVWFATASGNINTAGLWNSAPDGSGSTLTWPAASGDTLMANGFTITVNVATNLGADGFVRNDNANGATAGGTFNLGGGRTLTANAQAGNVGTACVTVASGGGIVVGNVTGGSAVNARGIVTSAGSVQVVGTVRGGTAAAVNSAGVAASGPYGVTVTGTVIGGTGIGVFCSNGFIYVTGEVYGSPTSSNGHGVSSANYAGPITITGNAIAQSGVAVSHTNVAGISCTVSGYAQASATKEAITNPAQAIVEVGETRSAPNGRGAVTGAFRYASATLTKSQPIIAGTQKTLSVLDVAALLPGEADVRAGVTYGDGAYTGTLALNRKRASMAGRF